MKKDQLHELLCQAVETEKGGVEVYQAAIGLAQNPDLRKEWEKYLEQTRHHVEVITGACEKLGIDPDAETPGRTVVRLFSQSLVKAMQEAGTADPGGAELVAAECVGHAEMKDHLNWELIGEAAKTLQGSEAKALEDAYGEVEDQEDEHLYHTQGWTRELWLKSIGAPAVLPPPEERKDVKSEREAAQARSDRETMLGGRPGASKGPGGRSPKSSPRAAASSPARRRSSEKRPSAPASRRSGSAARRPASTSRRSSSARSSR